MKGIAGMEIGALSRGQDRCEFRVWAPLKENITLCIISVAPGVSDENGVFGGFKGFERSTGSGEFDRFEKHGESAGSVILRTAPMQKDTMGYWHADLTDVPPGTRYMYRIDGRLIRPDPASAFQPEGVHGPSEVIGHDLQETTGATGARGGKIPGREKVFRGNQSNSPIWEDSGWRGVPLEEMIIYELHTGTFTQEGSFEAIIPRLSHLKELGVNAIELMPVAQFPGNRNWGYDGVFPFAVQNSYGGPMGLKMLVNACHVRGISVILDVVYNHIGPEGNYLQDFAPYFSQKYHTYWGPAINFDAPYSSEVRNYFIQNALFWFRCYHIDALRLDAVHAIFDMSAKHFLQELSEAAEAFSAAEGRKRYLIAESNLNDVRIIRPKEQYGYGIDAQWCDDFHHALHALLTGEREGYYKDFGTIEHMRGAVQSGFYYDWKYSHYRKTYFGSSTRGVEAFRFVVCSQNHDQIGNRLDGRRLSMLLPFEAAKLAAAAILLSPFVPLLFMGEECAADTPFYYFVSHSDEQLIRAVREGRRKEFQVFELKGDFPDPQEAGTFAASKLDWKKRSEGKHGTMLELYRTLIRLRTELPALKRLNKDGVRVKEQGSTPLLVYTRTWEDNCVLCIMNFSTETRKWSLDEPDFSWSKRFDSSDESWSGPGAAAPSVLKFGESIETPPYCFLVYERNRTK